MTADDILGKLKYWHQRSIMHLEDNLQQDRHRYWEGVRDLAALVIDNDPIMPDKPTKDDNNLAAGLAVQLEKKT